MPQDQIRNGQKVSPEALAAFYRHRSESLRRQSTVGREGKEAMSQEQQQLQMKRRPASGFFESIIAALQGHPGYIDQ